MKLRLDQLARHTKEPLLPVYVLFGDETLLMQEAADGLRRAARAQGFSERELSHAERGLDWNELLASANTLSLFGDRKILELRFNGKPDAAAASALESYAANPSPDNLLLLILPKLDGTAQKAKWFVACEAAGASIMVPSVDSAALPDWLQARARGQGLQLSPEALGLLVDKVEGNLLAAAQELEKLRLLHGEGNLTLEQVQAAVSDSARYNVYDLVDCALLGDAEKAARMLFGLKAEGQAESVVLWALMRDVRALVGISEGVAQGQQAFSLMQQFGIWQKRQPIIQQALRRHTLPRLQGLLADTLEIDKAIKGQSPDHAWDGLLRLTLALAGQPLFPELTP